MSSLFSRLIKHPIDYTGICKVTNLTLKEHRAEEGGVHTFIFTPEKPLTWKAGQHSLFTIPGQKITGKKWRVFSVASAPHENVIQISTNISPEPSSFKQELLALKPGDKIRMFGPLGEFYIKPKMKHIVGIVGGIGITPFRSIISTAAEHEIQIPITLIYSATEHHTYKAELDEWASKNPNIKIIYTHTPEEVLAELTVLTDSLKDSAHFFISGSPGMINSLQNTCLSQKIKKDNIVSDPFKGY